MGALGRFGDPVFMRVDIAPDRNGQIRIAARLENHLMDVIRNKANHDTIRALLVFP